MGDIMELETQLHNYLDTRKAINISALEKEAEVPHRSVWDWHKKRITKGVPSTIAKRNLEKVTKLLAEKYGF